MGSLKPGRNALWNRSARFALASLLLLVAVTSPSGEAAAKKRWRAPSIAAAIVVDMNANSILYEKDADTPRYPASLTKMMTLYVLFGYLRAGKLSFDSDLKVTAHASSQAPTKLGLKPGSTIRTTDAIKALVTQSANDAAVTIAENIGGSEENFARIMTQTARNLGMTNTTFRNASGLPDDDQVTTARDLATLASHLIRDYPEYYGFFATTYFTYAGRKYRNHNHLLFSYKGTDGIKTGYTRASGFNLVASVHRDNKHLVAVVLGGKTGGQRDAAMCALLDRQFPAASTAKKPASQSLVASLLDSVSPPAPAKKPGYALASAAADPILPAAAPVAREEGDVTGPEDTVPAAPAAQGPTPKRSTKPVLYKGAYHVQVGAYTSEAEAMNRLGMVEQRAPDLLGGHLPFTASFVKDDTEWFRARFAGFSKEDARSTCEALKKLSLDCAVMSAE